MRRRLLVWPLLCLFIVQACAGDQRAPTAVVPAPDASLNKPLPGCPTPAAVDAQIIAVVPVGKKIIAAVDFDLIVLAYRLGQTTQAQQAMFQLWSKLLNGYYAGKLVGGMSSQTQAAVLALGQAFYCSVGLDGSKLTLGGLGSTNIVQVVFPSSSSQTVITGDGNSGVMIPGNTLTGPTTIAITGIVTTFPEFKGPLNTLLDQFPPYSQFTAVPETSIGGLVTVATCVTDPNLPVSRAHMAHNVGAGIEILPTGDATFLNCGTTGSALRHSPFELVMAHDYHGAAVALRSMVGSLLATDADAFFDVGIGGKTTSFSPFAVVDTQVVVVPNSLTNQNAPAGSPVGSPPSVLVQTIGGKTPLPTVGVVFSITQGNGLLTLGNQSGSSVSGTTDATGTVTVGSWSIAAGTNNVQAVATYPAPPTGVGVSIAGNPVADTATGGDIIPYLSTNYQYLLAGTGDSVGFFNPSFSDTLSGTVGWRRGNASFGSGDVPGQSCPLDATVQTAWIATAPSAMLLRKTFAWPAQGTQDLTLGVAIDNDVQVYVNGTDITSTVQGGTVGADGYVAHEGCATQDSFTFTVSHTLLQAGTNLVAVRARDRGTVSYIDIRLSVPNTAPSPNRVKAPVGAASRKAPGTLRSTPQAGSTARLRLKP